jgi:hypothetical protein
MHESAVRHPGARIFPHLTSAVAGLALAVGRKRMAPAFAQTLRRGKYGASSFAKPSADKWRMATIALLTVGLGGTLAPRAEAVSATGGTVTNYTDAGGTNWTAHIFTNSVNATLTTNFNVTAAGPGDWVEYLIIAGGGGGAAGNGGADP